MRRRRRSVLQGRRGSCGADLRRGWTRGRGKGGGLFFVIGCLSWMVSACAKAWRLRLWRRTPSLMLALRVREAALGTGAHMPTSGAATARLGTVAAVEVEGETNRLAGRGEVIHANKLRGRSNSRATASAHAPAGFAAVLAFALRLEPFAFLPRVGLALQVPEPSLDLVQGLSGPSRGGPRASGAIAGAGGGGLRLWKVLED